jgi:diguanylate cyclase (GGDEF)-like protein
MTAAELERIVAEHRMLRESIEGNPMPYAVYDAEDRLIAFNKAYEATHAEAFHRLRHLLDARRLRYADLIRVTAEATLPPDQVEAHIAERVRRQREADGAAVDREYPGLGWLRVCKFATPSGAIAGFALDINELKQREAALEAQIARSSELERKLRELADTDVLTGLASRRAFMTRAAEEFQRARRYGGGLCVAMLDVDKFKDVNDRHGHAAGDGVLVQVAQACRAQMRSGADLCGRLGGEEFAVLMPQTGAGGAAAFAERMRAAIALLACDADGVAFGVTASFGVSEIAAGDADFSALLSRADAALYAAKGSGRNCVKLC